MGCEPRSGTPSHKLGGPAPQTTMHERAEKAWRARALMGSDATLTFKVNIAAWVSLPDMNHPINCGRVVLHPKLRTLPLGRWWVLADDTQANDLLWSSAWFGALFRFTGHSVTSGARGAVSDKAELSGRPSVSALATDAARPRSRRDFFRHEVLHVSLRVK